MNTEDGCSAIWTVATLLLHRCDRLYSIRIASVFSLLISTLDFAAVRASPELTNTTLIGGAQEATATLCRARKHEDASLTFGLRIALIH